MLIKTAGKALMIGSLCLVMTACATRYQPASNHVLSSRTGYSSTQVTETVFTVSFKGNQNTSRKTVTDYALLHSAEISLKQGYDYFEIVTDENHNDSNGAASPYLGSSTGRHFNFGVSYLATKPVKLLTIRLHKTQPADNGLVLSAREVRQNIRQQYQLPID